MVYVCNRVSKNNIQSLSISLNNKFKVAVEVLSINAYIAFGWDKI